MDTADEGNPDIPIEDALALADREWRAMGVLETDRAALLRDLRVELAGAAGDGVTPRQLLGDDVGAFARDLALEAGVRRAPYEFRRLLLTALAGATPGLVLAWLLIWQQWPVPVPFDPASPGYGIARYAVCAVTVLAGAVLAVSQRMRDRPGTDRTALGMAVLVPVAGGLAVPVTMGFAALTGYSTALPVLAVEAAIVGGALGGATVLARWWALVPVLGPGRRVNWPGRTTPA